jgi:hypothetical protein
MLIHEKKGNNMLIHERKREMNFNLVMCRGKGRRFMYGMLGSE